MAAEQIKPYTPSIPGGGMMFNTTSAEPSAASSTGGFDWGSLLGALGSAGASYYAGQQLTDAQRQALGSQMASANTSQAQLAPYQAIGSSAAEALRSGDYTGTQLYKTGLAQSEQAINRGLASRGQFGSGGAMKALQENAQNYNTNYTNTLGNMARLGLGATQQSNQLYTGLGNAQASSQLGQTQSNLAGLTGIAGALSSYLAGKNQSGQSNLGSLLSGAGGLISSAGSSIWDWMNSPDQPSAGNWSDVSWWGDSGSSGGSTGGGIGWYDDEY